MIETTKNVTKYLKYVAIHKYHVFVECAKQGIPLQGIIHDWHKFLPSEFMPYYRHFYGDIHRGRDESGYYKPTDTGDPEFDYAWLMHVSRGRHHWQFWILPCDEDGTGTPTDMKVYEMPLKYRKEMLADWIGAGKAQGTKGVQFWWEKNKGKMILGPETRAWLQDEIDSITQAAGCVESPLT